MLVTAESGVGPKLTKISGGVNHGHLEEGGPKKAKIQYGVKPDILKLPLPPIKLETPGREENDPGDQRWQQNDPGLGQRSRQVENEGRALLRIPRTFYEESTCDNNLPIGRHTCYVSTIKKLTWGLPKA